jgi:hypothetical protein
MVVNPYRSSESSSVLPVISGPPSKDSYLFCCLNTFCCGLLSKKANYYNVVLRLFIALLLLTVALTSYYFHLHFTHPTLISGNNGIPPKFLHSNNDPVLLPLKNGVPETGSDLFRLRRGSKPENIPFPEAVAGLPTRLREGEVSNGIEKDKDPIAYNPDHFHRHREPFKFPPKPVLDTSMIKSVNRSFVPPPLTRSREKADFSFVRNHSEDSSILDSSTTNSSRVSIPKFQLDPSKQNSKLKDELMKKLNAMKAGKAFSDFNEMKNTQTAEKEETGKGKEEPTKGIPPVTQQQQSTSEPFVSAEEQTMKNLLALPEANRTFDKPSFDLPPPLVERLKQTDFNSKGLANDGSVSSGKKINYCSGQVDPFEKIPVDQFIPPKGAPFETVTVWKKKINEFLKSISQLKIGGAALREKLANEVSELKILRFKLFCQYA